MPKKLHLLLLPLLLAPLAGCHTIQNAAQGAACGANQDAQAAAIDIQKLDAWMQEHMW